MTHDTFRKLEGYKKISEATEKYSNQSVTNGSLEDMTCVMGGGVTRHIYWWFRQRIQDFGKTAGFQIPLNVTENVRIKADDMILKR